jgi:hypothetical protein
MFKKGQSGNPSGTKPERLWAATIRRACLEGNGAKLRKLAEKLIKLALEGDTTALKEIGDRIDGKAPFSVEVSRGKGIRELSDDEIIERIEQLRAEERARPGRRAVRQAKGEAKSQRVH